MSNKEDALRRALLHPTIGRRLQEVRKALGMTGADVVERIPGLNRSTLSEIENDVAKRTNYLPALARIYEISEETLLRPDLKSLMGQQTIGERIKIRRESLNYNRNELAERIPGLTYHGLYMMEEKGRQGDLLPDVLRFLGLDQAEEESNASALLRHLRTTLFLDTQTWCGIAACTPDELEKAEEGDAGMAVRLIVDIAHNLLEGYQVAHDEMVAKVFEVDASGRLAIPTEGDLPAALEMPDGSRLFAAPGDPSEGDRVMAVMERRGTRSGIVGTYRGSTEGSGLGPELVDAANISHRLPLDTTIQRLLPFQEFLSA